MLKFSPEWFFGGSKGKRKITEPSIDNKLKVDIADRVFTNIKLNNEFDAEINEVIKEYSVRFIYLFMYYWKSVIFISCCFYFLFR